MQQKARTKERREALLYNAKAKNIRHTAVLLLLSLLLYSRAPTRITDNRRRKKAPAKANTPSSVSACNASLSKHVHLRVPLRQATTKSGVR